METNRREFLKDISAALLGMSLVGCKRKQDPARTIKVNGQNYVINNGVINQSPNQSTQIKLGIMTDLHAHRSNSQYFADQLNKEKVDAYFLAGDLSRSFGDYAGANNDYEEILGVVEPVAATGKLVLTIPGNHEQRKTYARALDYLISKYPNVVDMQRVPVADLNGLNIVALGGNDNPQFNVPEGFLLGKNDFDKFGELAKQYGKEKPLLAATHVPQRYQTRMGLDVVESGKRNVGAIDLARVRKTLGSNFAVSGHIHEAYGLITPEEEIVKQGELSDKLDFNPGAVYDHIGRNFRPAAGILEFQNGKARAYILNR